MTIEEMEEILNEVAEGLPEVFYKELNGGILLLPQSRMHPKSIGDDLFIMGEYHRGGSQGRYIVIYYGSFEQVYGQSDRSVIKRRLEETLKHEFTHHLESLAGERGLEKQDERDMNRYLSKKVRRK